MSQVFTLWSASADCAKGYDIQDGQVIKVPAKLAHSCSAMRVSVTHIEELAVTLRTTKPGQFLTSGISGVEHHSAVRRLKEHFPFPDAGGVLVLDGDGLEELGIHSASDYVQALREVEPALKDVGIVTAPSASSFVRWPGGEYALRGLHAFILVDRADQIPSLLERIFTKGLAAGYIRAKISKRGTILTRGLVDLAMQSSNQPCFEGGARLLHPDITQHRDIQIFPGGVLVADSVLAPDTEVQQKADAQIKRIQHEHLEEATRQKALWCEQHKHTLTIGGMSDTDASATVKALSAIQGYRIDLPPDWPICLDSGEMVTVQHILDNRHQFDGVTCCDPLEPETGKCKAMVFCGADQAKPVIHSFAHGEVIYFLKSKFSFTNLTEGTNHYQTRATEVFSSITPASRSSFYEGCLTTTDDNGRARKMVQSHARDRILPELQGHFAWSESQTWHLWTGTHWQAVEGSAEFEKAVHDLVEAGLNPLGFSPSYLNGINDLILKCGKLKLPVVNASEWLPFHNGLLNLTTQELIPATPTTALTWCIPFDYQPGADCPTIKAWLSQVVDGDTEMVEYLRAWLGAILLGLSDLQRFAYIKGPGGTGKSTFIRLAEALVGQPNIFITDLRNLETNRFEIAGILGKRLVVINDAAKYGGSLEVLKALTGEDALRLERKNRQQSGSFTFKGIVMMTSNEDLVTSDLTSGLDRRVATISFTHRITEEQKAEWVKKGGEHAVLHHELPGLVNWLLKLGTNQIRTLIKSPPAAATSANYQAMLANNPVARWLVEHCTPSPGTHTLLGEKKEFRSQSGTVEFVDAGIALYPNYLEWCHKEHIHTLAKQRFKNTLMDTANTLKVPLTQGRMAGDGRTTLIGLRLREAGESEFRWGAMV